MPELELSDDVWEALRAPAEVPPVGEVVARGRQLRRRRHGVVLGAGLAVTVAVTVALNTTFISDDRPAVDVVAADPPAMATGQEAAPVLLRIDTGSTADLSAADDVYDLVVLTDGTVIVQATLNLANMAPLVWPLRTGTLPTTSVEQLTATLATIDPTADLTVAEAGPPSSITTVSYSHGGVERSLTALRLGAQHEETGPRRALAMLVDRATQDATAAATEPYDPVAYRVMDLDATPAGQTPVYPGDPTLPDPGGSTSPIEGNGGTPDDSVVDPSLVPQETTPSTGPLRWPFDGPLPAPCTIVDDPADVATLTELVATMYVAPRADPPWLVDGERRHLVIAPLLPGDPGCEGG